MKTSVFKKLLLTAALVAAPLAGEAFAHGSMKPQHGGQVALAGETVIELVRSGHGVTVYLSDEDQPVPAAGMTGKLIITQGGKKSDVALTSAGGNRLQAHGVKIASGAKVTVSLVSKATQERGAVSFTAK